MLWQRLTCMIHILKNYGDLWVFPHWALTCTWHRSGSWLPWSPGSSVAHKAISDLASLKSSVQLFPVTFSLKPILQPKPHNVCYSLNMEALSSFHNFTYALSSFLNVFSLICVRANFSSSLWTRSEFVDPFLTPFSRPFGKWHDSWVPRSSCDSLYDETQVLVFQRSPPLECELLQDKDYALFTFYTLYSVWQ